MAISVYCALTTKDFLSGVLLAVNHDGDSDSTGAITGVDDCQKAMPHRGGQCRPSLDHTLKIRWNACGHVFVSRNLRLR